MKDVCRTRRGRALVLFFGLSQIVGLSQVGPASAQNSCLAEIGKARAAELVDRCLDVSPATHPPCNARNACSLIKDEIERGCRMLGSDAPAYCKT